MLIYQDGGLKLQVRLDGQTAWLTQTQLGELYQTSKQNISLHIQNIARVRSWRSAANALTRFFDRVMRCYPGGLIGGPPW